MSAPHQMIAAAIQRERSRAGKSLSALAAQAGIAKSTLSQLEAGNGNPSVETLWALAAALDIPLSQLFETEAPATTLIRAGQGEPLESEQSDFTAVLLSRCPPNVRRDIYRVVMQPGEVRCAQPHPRGTVEHMLVCFGQMRAGPDGQEEVLQPGDYYTYPGDRPHRYEALQADTLFLMVMEAP
ncbi:helix-turn-helix domain-containing protein [Leisingera aquaemixtae]|uniref:HTH-type transcriptional regulator SinR n=1 Tax=Leisingera aquaemixtae TaxID=1396826 RepID=A0A0N7M565_9RHOB|nr:XRE family transcriptional regulator [Leisingera aquaemixtae]CUI01570.1 HTH-type transcriptional regulator SinR [Leisingera aquaemixtae]